MSKAAAKDIMTRDVITIRDSATLREAAEILATHRISGAPVVDVTGNLVGIISESDLIDENKRKAHIPRLALFGLYKVPEKLLMDAFEEGANLLAQDVMSRDVLTAEEDAPVEDLAETILSKKINRIPVLNEGKIVGIVTRQDILRGLWDIPPAPSDEKG